MFVQTLYVFNTLKDFNWRAEGIYDIISTSVSCVELTGFWCDFQCSPQTQTFVSIKIYYFSSAQLLVNTNIHSSNHSNSITDRHASHAEAVIQTEHQKEDKGDLHDFKHGVVVGARRDGLSISKIPDLLEFSHTSTSLQ